MKGAGWKKIGEMEWKDAKYPIQVNVESGLFAIEVPTKDPTAPMRFVGKDLDALRESVKGHFMQETELQWEPMIQVWNDATRGELDLSVRRYFKAKLGDGKVLWRSDKGKYDREPELDGSTLQGRDVPDYGTFIPYDRESWKLLRNLERGIYEFHEIVDYGVRQGNIEALLEILLEGGMELLSKNPKKWRIEGRGY